MTSVASASAMSVPTRGCHYESRYPARQRDEIGWRLDRLDAVSRHGPWRKLKELGLTESLKTGYRLSPRGKTVIDDRP